MLIVVCVEWKDAKNDDNSTSKGKMGVTIVAKLEQC